MNDSATQREVTGVVGAEFALDPRLAADCGLVGDLALSRVLLMNDSRYDWLILVPRQPGAVELTDLEEAAHLVLTREIRAVSRALQQHAAPLKINVAALGNMVRQLHVHIVARRGDDAAWPGPVWGVGVATPHTPAGLAQACARWRVALELVFD